MNATTSAYFDLDGTLADRRHRMGIYLPGAGVDWAPMYAPENVLKGPLLETGNAHHQQFAAQGAEIWYLTARKERNRPATAQCPAVHAQGRANCNHRWASESGGVERHGHIHAKSD